MRRLLLLSACFIFFVAAIVSCKKDSTTTSRVHGVTYKIITNDYSRFSDIIYANENDSLVHVSSVDSTSSFSKEILTTTVPFYAKIAATGFNNSGSDFNFTLQIFMDGAKVAEQAVVTAPHLSFDANATFTIQ